MNNTPSALVEGRAYISDDGLYRYSLTRDVAPLTGDCTCTFVMLNPSTADADQDDPTIRRCIAFARGWGFARLKVVNLFAYRATDPKELLLCDDPSGPENLCTIAKVVGGSDLVVCAWGWFPHQDRIDHIAAVLELIAAPHCLGTTKNGSPRHPLYVRGDTAPMPYAHCPSEATWGRRFVTDAPMRMQAERDALIESAATMCLRCMVPYGQYGCTHRPVTADRLLATVNGIAAGEERKQRIRNARHALRYRAEARERRSWSGTPSSQPILFDHLTAENLARRFHEVYESLAPAFEYETRAESAVPWEQVPNANRRLMIAVADVLLDEIGCRDD